MPHKHNADGRHHTLFRVLSRPKMSFKVQNWPAYEAGLRRRGSLTLRIEDAALECWQTIGPSGRARYREAAIQTSLMLRTAFKLALRQTEGPPIYPRTNAGPGAFRRRSTCLSTIVRHRANRARGRPGPGRPKQRSASPLRRPLAGNVTYRSGRRTAPGLGFRWCRAGYGCVVAISTAQVDWDRRIFRRIAPAASNLALS